MQVLAFFLITFACTWLAWYASAAYRGLPGFGIGGPLFLLGVFMPGIAAIALTVRRDGRHGVATLLARIGRWEVNARYYAFALGYMAMLRLGAAVLQRLATGAWPRFGDTPVPLIVGAILISTWVQAGEEVGWRGFALPRLAARLGLPAASVVLGVIWAAWHLPLFFLAGTGTDGQSFPLYLLHVTAISVAMAWLYWKTGGSLLLTMLMHAAVNNTIGIVPAAVPGASDVFSLSGSFIGWATVGLGWIVAVPLLVRMRRAALD